MRWDPLVALGIRLLGPPMEVPDEELERIERLGARAGRAVEEKKEELRRLAPSDPRAAAQLRALLAEEVERMDAYVYWAAGFGSTEPDSALVKMQRIVQTRIEERRQEIRTL
jgi:hypothetical protein